MAFHFSGNASMMVLPQDAFFVGGARREHFCLVVVASPYDARAGGLSLIGTYQQRNQRWFSMLIEERCSFALRIVPSRDHEMFVINLALCVNNDI